MNIIKGMCLCEKVKYEIEGDLGPVFNCHCSKCRRWHGAAFRTRASINKSQFTILTGNEYLSVFKSSENASKHFCNQCGSPLHSTYDDRPEVIGIPLGALEGVKATPEAHIFVNSKATWFDINDNLPQFDKWPGEEANVRKTNS